MAKQTSKAEDRGAPAYRVRFEHDPYYQFESPDGGPLPESQERYETNYVQRKSPDGSWRRISYEEYCRYEGNPDRHVAVCAIVERQCPCCGTWKVAGSLGGIDLMDDDPGLGHLDVVIPENQIGSLPEYLLEVAEELIADAREEEGEKR